MTGILIFCKMIAVINNRWMPKDREDYDEVTSRKYLYKCISIVVVVQNIHIVTSLFFQIVVDVDISGTTLDIFYGRLCNVCSLESRTSLSWIK